MRGGRLRPVGPDDLDPVLPCCVNCVHGSLANDAAWIDATLQRFGALGVRLVDQGVPIGQLLVAAPESLPEQGIWSTTALSSDAVVVIMVGVVDHDRGHGVGRQLVQSAAGMALRRKVPALEVIGAGRGTCATPPIGWLRRVGFEVTRSHPLTPRLRLDLSSTVRLPGLRRAWTSLAELVRPLPPAPAGRGPVTRHHGEATGRAHPHLSHSP